MLWSDGVLNDASCQVRRYGGTRDAAAQLMTTGVLAAGQHTTHGALFRFRVRMLSLQHTSVCLSVCHGKHLCCDATVPGKHLTVYTETATLKFDTVSFTGPFRELNCRTLYSQGKEPRMGALRGPVLITTVLSHG